MADNSDYKKPRTKLFDLLPEVYKSDTNRALFGNLFDRYLTKQETERVAGYIGEGNPNAIVPRQIKEFNVHRQAFQLQPILHNKVGTVEWMSSWMDILNEVKRQGVDEERIQEWMSLLKFNWVPPIDIDKLIHYQDYYWYDADNPNSSPQYITIRSRCSTATAMANFHQRLIDEFVDDEAPMYILELRKSEGATDYDTIIIDGDYGRLFETDFVFYITGSDNVELNNAFWEVASSKYDETINRTFITMKDSVSSDTASGLISLEEKLAMAVFAKNCQCNSALGWDVLPWDDNPSAPSIWFDATTMYTDPCGQNYNDFASWLEKITHPGDPFSSTPCGEGQVWFDQNDDILYQYGADGWKNIRNKFSLIVNEITGTNLWDFIEGCGVKSIIPSADQWIDENKWFHKLDIPNFSIAKQAQVPIIEYDWDLELNEWTYTRHQWKYRASRSNAWEIVDDAPEYIEMVPLTNYERAPGGVDDAIILDDRYGDLTDYFAPGRQFLISSINQVFEVLESTFRASAPGRPRNTIIRTTEDIDVPILFAFGDITSGTPARDIYTDEAPLRPIKSSRGDTWKGFHEHWLLTDFAETVPVVHQPDNPLGVIDQATPPVELADYDTRYNYFAQFYDVQYVTTNDTFELTNNVFPGTSKNLRNRAMKGTNNIRVYVNDIRQYGTYVEQTSVELGSGSDSVYVAGIKFSADYIPKRFDKVLIQVGEATVEDTGYSEVEVRMEEDDILFASNGTVTRTLVKYRREEQVKTRTNQYPLFDLYNVDGTPAYKAESLFEFSLDSNSSVNTAIGMRLKVDGNNNYYFTQTLLEEDGGVLYAYRDYFGRKDDVWVDTDTDTVYFWNDYCWSDKQIIAGYDLEAAVGILPPGKPWTDIDGSHWYDTLNHQLKVYDFTLGDWVVEEVLISPDDPTLQTIWKKGLNDEKYIPEKVDWAGRSESEYDAERAVFIEETYEEIVAADTSLTQEQGEAQAQVRWEERESNHFWLEAKEQDGLTDFEAWVDDNRDWELPDPLYYNQSHENRREVSMAEVVTHFGSIIDAQPKVPAYNGPLKGMFHLIPFNEVNFGLGGTIREYQYGFDTFLSALFVNEVSPRSLFNFAHDQYEILLNSLKENYSSDVLELLGDTSEESLENISRFIVSEIIERYEQNDVYAQIYGDTTTFTDNIGSDDVGVRNWIATLPFLKLAKKVSPSKVTDEDRGLNHIVHHDGHREDYFLDDAIKDGVSFNITQVIDTRIPLPSSGSTDPAATMGIMSTDSPPDTVEDFETQYGTSIALRRGVFWYQKNAERQTLYRLSPLSIGYEVPAADSDNGSMWLDLNPGSEALRVKRLNANTGDVEWIVPLGITPGESPIKLHNGADVDSALVSAWKEVDLNEILRDVIFEVERRLYESAPDFKTPAYDFKAIADQYPTEFKSYMEEQFLLYMRERDITTPFSNTIYDAGNPFTWNYKNSTHGNGYQIVDVDVNNNALIIEGDHEEAFNPCLGNNPHSACSTTGALITFYVKNSPANDGTKTILNTFANPGAVTDTNGEFTTLYVNQPVDAEPGGLIYLGVLPSSVNTGAESGGDWRDVYDKFYNTPFPHLEPWKMQGYEGKPSWWDEEYLNDDSRKWGDRRWKYKHGFDIRIAGNTPATGSVFSYGTLGDAVQSYLSYGSISTPPTTGLVYGSISDAINLTTDKFVIDGDFRELFASGRQFSIDGGSPHDGAGWTVDNLGSFATGTPGAAGSASVEIAGDETFTFVEGLKFTIDDASGNVLKLLTVTGSVYSGPPFNRTIIQVEEAIDDMTGFAFYGGATYSEATNQTTILVANDVLVDTVDDGRIMIRHGMWERVRTGEIPPGREYPNGVPGITGTYQDISVYQLPVPPIPTYNYFSVNITNHTIDSSGEYNPDEVFPPYWDHSAHFGNQIEPFDLMVRSLYYLFTTEIVAPAADYVFGDAGGYEWLWRESSQYEYDLMASSFRLDPIRFIHSTFGPDYNQVGGLLIDSRSEKPLTHVRADFHGDLVDGSIYKVNGLNQWYTNYLRYTGVDISMSDFRTMWADWTAPLMYQFSSFIDTPSLDVGHRQICLSEFDYRVAAKRSPGVQDYWLDSFMINIIESPPKVARQDNEQDWKLSLSTKSPFGNTIEYYDVQRYPFYVDKDNDLCVLYSWELTNIDFFNDTMSIVGDQTDYFTTGRTFELVECSDASLDGTYTIKSSVFDAVNNRTIIDITTNLPPTTANDGRVVLDYREIPWETGENVILSSTGYLPTPLEGDNQNGVFQYFIIRVSNNSFRLALSANEAANNAYINISSDGAGDQFVAKLLTTFFDESRVEIWKHYALDKTNVLSFMPPHEFRGIQNLINIADGYQAYSEDQGWVFNADNSLKDQAKSALSVSWQHELIRFIDFAKAVRLRKRKVDDRHPIEIDINTSTWTITDGSSPMFITGDPVKIYSSNQVYPDPLFHGGRYYMIRDTLETFRLAATKADAIAGNEITIASIAGTRDLYLTNAGSLNYASAQFEINPFRNAVWFRPERGIVSNVLSGPTDAFSSHVLVDQYGRAIQQDIIRVYREDKETKIAVEEAVPNDVELTSVYKDPYNFIHLGAAHLFVDTYEHVLIFSEKTTEGQLIYDPFIGLNITKFEMLYNRQQEFTQRPNVGGQYLKTFYNQGADLERNFEASIEDIRNLYDTYRTIEANELVAQGRKSLGYEKDNTYLDNLNLNAKSQFVYWKGQIQHKGAMTSMRSFINSRRFIDAKVDEYWAVKVADFGANLDKEYIEMWLQTDDVRNDDLFLQFVGEDNVCDTGFASNAFDSSCGYSFPNSGEGIIVSDPGWSGIALTDISRWVDYPDQYERLRNNAGLLYFDLKPEFKIPITISDSAPINPADNDGWIEFTQTEGGGVKLLVTEEDNGDAYFYDLNPDTGNWDEEEETQITSESNPGRSVCMAASGEVAIIAHSSSYYNPGSGNYTGGALIFRRNQTGDWNQHQLLSETSYSSYGGGTTSFTFGGTAVYISGDGNYAFYSSDNANYIFVYYLNPTTDQYEFQQELSSPSLNFRNDFGDNLSVNYDGTLLVAGDADVAETYVFSRSGTVWTVEQTINTPAQGFSFDSRFGDAIAISQDGTTLAIGDPNAPRVAGDMDDTGAVYVYTRSGTNWNLTQTLQPADLVGGEDQGEQIDDGDKFGSVVDVSYDGSVIAGKSDNLPSAGDWRDYGAVYLFVKNGSVWEERDKVEAPPGEVSYTSNYGRGLSLTPSGEVLVVAADSLDDVGGVFSYTTTDFNTWSFNQSMEPETSGGYYYGSYTTFGKALDANGRSASTGPSIFRRYNSLTDNWDFHGTWDITVEGSLPYLRHDMRSDLVTLTAMVTPSSWTADVISQRYYDITSSDFSPSGKLASLPEYVPFSSMIKVMRETTPGSGEYQVLEPNVDYAEETTSNFYATNLIFANDLSAYKIRVIYGMTTFTEGVHYEAHNANIVKFNFVEMGIPDIADLTMWGWIFNKDALNPHSIVDNDSGTVITPMQIWDAARGIHYYNADHIIDLRLKADPAFYSYTLETDDNQRRRVAQLPLTPPIPFGERGVEEAWGAKRVGTTFLNTREMGYVPYYDPRAIPKLEDRLLLWGQMAEWSDVKIVTWVESDVHPESWNDLAQSEESDISIPQQLRKSGRISKTVFQDVSGSWLPAANMYETFDPVIDDQTRALGDTTYQFETTTIDPTSDNVVLYINGFAKSNWTATSSTEIEVNDLALTDRVVLVKFVPGKNPHKDDATNTAELAAAVEAGTHAEDYQYSTTNYIDSLNQERTKYYFWVEDKITKGNKLMSPQNAQETMKEFPGPYVVYQDVNQTRAVTFEDNTINLPPHFSRAVLRGLRPVIRDNNRYMIRWTRDFTLRDNLGEDLKLKNYHEQWQMIRREMPYHVPRWLWDRMIESIVGYKLTDSTIRVPSYQRELYDMENESDTRFGIGDGQSFTDGELALQTILTILNDPDRDFSPIDINAFFNQQDFESPEGIIAALDSIYNNFAYLHVNEMFFEVLLDAFSKKRKYEDIFKTSMIAVHGIRPFQVGGLFDD